jgi:hypothetical protein
MDPRIRIQIHTKMSWIRNTVYYKLFCLQGDDKVRYKCPSCPHESRNPAELRQHVLGKHEGVTHACSLCQFTTTHPSSLKRHRLNQHAELRFACDAHSAGGAFAVANNTSSNSSSSSADSSSTVWRGKNTSQTRPPFLC